MVIQESTLCVIGQEIILVFAFFEIQPGLDGEAEGLVAVLVDERVRKRFVVFDENRQVDGQGSAYTSESVMVSPS